MADCQTCKYLFRDWSVGYSQCTKTKSFSDPEWDEYEDHGELRSCKYYEEAEGWE